MILKMLNNGVLTSYELALASDLDAKLDWPNDDPTGFALLSTVGGNTPRWITYATESDIMGILQLNGVAPALIVDYEEQKPDNLVS